jgi:hypothetical protein
MSYTITGTVHSVEAEQSREYNGKTFKSRDVILSCPETINGNTYPNFPKLSAKLDKVLPHVANLQQGQTVTLHFNIKGFNGQKGNFTGLEIWKVEAAQTQQSAPQQSAPQQAQPMQATKPEDSFEMPF